jgi:hypothetical protein
MRRRFLARIYLLQLPLQLRSLDDIESGSRNQYLKLFSNMRARKVPALAGAASALQD